MGYYYDAGLGVLADARKAVEWYTKAAEQGHAPALRNLGMCFEKGVGVQQKDMPEAIRLFTKAAEQGDAEAQRILGTCYQKGRGVQRDLSEAMRWFAAAAECAIDLSLARGSDCCPL